MKLGFFACRVRGFQRRLSGGVTAQVLFFSLAWFYMHVKEDLKIGFECQSSLTDLEF